MILDEARGNWALVTGASSGIGKEFAFQLAAFKINLILVARRETLINSTAFELASHYGIKTIPLPFDLSDINSPEKISAILADEGIKIRILINNAAFGKLGNFINAPLEKYQKMLSLNVNSVVSLCYCFFKDLTSHSSSAIINVSSQAAINPTPYMAVYGATKAFVSSFSQALYGEWAKHGVHVQTLIPGPTNTEFDCLAGNYPINIKYRAPANEIVKKSLTLLATDVPVVTSAKGILKQKIFMTLAPAKLAIKTASRIFEPPA